MLMTSIEKIKKQTWRLKVENCKPKENSKSTIIMLQVEKWKNQQHIEGHGYWTIYWSYPCYENDVHKRKSSEKLYIDVHIDLNINTNAFKDISFIPPNIKF